LLNGEFTEGVSARVIAGRAFFPKTKTKTKTSALRI